MIYIYFAIEVVAIASVLFVAGLLIWSACQRIEAWFFATTPEEVMPDDVYLPDQELANLPKALHRLKEMNFRRMRCGHHPYSWNAVRGECEQCVLEGRSAKRDMGRNKR